MEYSIILELQIPSNIGTDLTNQDPDLSLAIIQYLIKICYHE